MIQVGFSFLNSSELRKSKREMSTTCFRPPPLPPSKKSAQMTNGNRQRAKQNHSLLSSTYLSFRDPADDEILSVEEIELTSFRCKSATSGESGKRSGKLTHTSSLNRKRGGRALLTRSHSDGNLDKAGTSGVCINRYMKVLSGSWKNLLNLGGMSRPPKPAATAKKVAPPAVPHEFRHSGSSFGSAGYASSEDAGFLAPSDPPGVPRDDHSDYGSTVSGSTGKSPGPIFPAPTFTFPGQPPPGTVLTHKAAVYYHHQLSLQEDQGIDMTQSPGRDSPGSSSGSAGSGSRHSTASLDSGRASYHPLSTAGRSTIGSSNSPRCSLSSCSIGSDQGRIERMIHQGVPDQEIIHSWLVDLQFEEYFPLFISAGYDLPTIGRMTPEDLTAVGIKKPNHRKRLKAEIAQLNLPDNLPEFIPGSLEEWLNLLRLDEYLPAFLDQNYQTVDDVAQLTWEDLEEFGIVKLGHQKKIMLAIKRIKDIKAGKRIHTDSNRIYATQDVLVHAPMDPPPSPGLQPAVHSTFHSFHQPWEIDQTRQLQLQSGTAAARHYLPPTYYFTDIVPIKIRTGRGKSLESLEDPNERTHHTFTTDNSQPFYYQQPIGWRPRSYDDGDITPTNETGLLYEGGGTLPRPRGIIRPRPIAKIAAKARETFPEFEKPQFNPEKYVNPQYKTLPRELMENQKYHMQYGSPLMGKKIPPNPPKRQDSECHEQTTTVEIHHVQTSSPLPLPAYPSSDSLSISLDSQGDLPLPPPPAPGTPPGASQCKLNSSQSWGAEEQELIKTLALQHRNGSDASFKSSSSTESDSLPFANENAGTIRTRAGTRQAEFSSPKPRASSAGLPPHPSPTPTRQQSTVPRNQRTEPVDVLNDIGNMLANLTDELDAMLEEEKRQQ
ncbi:CRK like proto-oncogene, adaptor protein isoform X2 [Leptinotarsa decemlineata]|uniref:CRK like proto-oncogene, adaptor protein isoform X2 n=1 Tax=Leptinotarsa decemlineata TaxID=7539 RepID=UPI000C255460|nr:caskin-1 isoform X2 [Leptinotarsa decemlineata]